MQTLSTSISPSPITASPEPAVPPLRVAYFAHEIADPAVQKRIRMLEAGGASVTLLGFERRRFAEDGGPRPIVLGRTENAKLFARVFSVLGAIPRAWAARAAWDEADVLIARNLEMLVIVGVMRVFASLRTRVVYECLDIHRLLLKPGAVGKLMRALERACLRHVSLVMTSSPAFLDHYFRATQHYEGEALLVENKVLAPAERRPVIAPAPSAPPWRIAWCGVLRCRKSLEVLRALAETHRERVVIALWGAPARDQIPDFDALVSGLPNLAFRGRYKPEDLPRLYGDAHFVWAIDYYEAGGNSDWLLPNRLYEGLYYGAVPIAVAGVETARWLEQRKLGVVLDAAIAPALQRFIEGCSMESYAPLRRAAAALDPNAVAFSADGCRALADELRNAEIAP